MKIIVATKNKNKVSEIKEIMTGFNFDFVTLDEAGIDIEVEETGKTFEENALIKARSVSVFCDSPVMADDSGLCVDALGGKPGIYSARYCGEDATDEDRINKLLEELKGVEDRSAKFVSVAAIVFPDGNELVARGEVFGSIDRSPKGNSGFGYDPIFYSDELGKTFGEATAEEKNSISHRKRALEELKNMINNVI